VYIPEENPDNQKKHYPKHYVGCTFVKREDKKVVLVACNIVDYKNRCIIWLVVDARNGLRTVVLCCGLREGSADHNLNAVMVILVTLDLIEDAARSIDLSSHHCVRCFKVVFTSVSNSRFEIAVVSKRQIFLRIQPQ